MMTKIQRILLFVIVIAIAFVAGGMILNHDAIELLAAEVRALRIDMMGYFDFYKKLAARIIELEERVMILEYYLLQSLRAVPR